MVFLLFENDKRKNKMLSGCCFWLPHTVVLPDIVEQQE